MPSARSITGTVNTRWNLHGPLAELDCNEIVPQNEKWRKMSNTCTKHRSMYHLKTNVVPLLLTAFSAVLCDVKGKGETRNKILTQ